MSFQQIGVVGAGNMGSGIAQKIATEGFPVVVADLGAEALQRGEQRIRETLQQGVERKLFTPERAAEILGRVSFSAELGALRDCDVVIEAIFEDRAAKQRLFAELDRVCAPKTILGTNTSSFYVRELADATQRPDRVVGLHYFYHPAKNRLVEVVPGEKTSEETRRRAWLLQELIGKTPIHSADAPGFVVNRYFVPWLNEAVRLLAEGVADIATIDAAAKQRFEIGMGPFELMNVTGVPIALHAATTLGEELGPFYAPAKRLAQQVAAKQNWDLSGTPDAQRFAAVGERLFAAIAYVACELVEAGVATIEDTDIGARVGLRWAKGPFELINAEGVARTLELVHHLLAPWKEQRVPALLRRQAEHGKPFAIQLVKSEKLGGLATLTINRPDALNALNPEVVKQLASAFHAAAQDPEVKAIVLAGAGKAFVAGADLKFFVDALAKNDFTSIYNFTRQGQDLLLAFAQCTKPVIAWLDGLSLGGGSEMALACDYIVASPRGSMGFPETGIGIYPGLGGTQRPTRRMGVGLTRFFVLSGAPIDAKTGKELGLIDELVSPADAPAVFARLAAKPKPAPRAVPTKVPEAWAPVAEHFTAHELDAILGGKLPPPAHPLAAKMLPRLAQKAPLALRHAFRLIGEGAAKATTREACELEMQSLREIFGTADAKEGLSSAVERRRPSYTGR